jgi:hypothetical protein
MPSKCQGNQSAKGVDAYYLVNLQQSCARNRVNDAYRRANIDGPHELVERGKNRKKERSAHVASEVKLSELHT